AGRAGGTGSSHRPGGRRGNPDEVQDPQDPAPDRRGVHDRPCARGRGGAEPAGAGGRGPAPAGSGGGPPPGPGRAARHHPGQCGLEALTDAPASGGTRGTVVVTYGDVPLLTTELLTELVQTHEADSNAVTVLTALLEDPAGYGRILRDTDGSVAGIVEHKDAT